MLKEKKRRQGIIGNRKCIRANINETVNGKERKTIVMETGIIKCCQQTSRSEISKKWGWRGQP